MKHNDKFKIIRDYLRYNGETHVTQAVTLTASNKFLPIMMETG